MLVNYTYLLINIFSIIVPVIFSFHKAMGFYKNLASCFKAIFLVGLIFVAWDIYFTQQGVWGFNKQYLSGLKVFNLPFEEILFFICIPYACIFTHEVYKYFDRPKSKIKDSVLLGCFTGTIFLCIALTNFTKAYSFSSFSLLGFTLIFLQQFQSFSYAWKIFNRSCIAISFAFLIVNGLLTGIAFEEAVVWYNSAEQFGIKIFTIPIEDFSTAIFS